MLAGRRIDIKVAANGLSVTFAAISKIIEDRSIVATVDIAATYIILVIRRRILTVTYGIIRLAESRKTCLKIYLRAI